MCYNYVSFWVDHATSFVYVTFHASKAATELARSKSEFEHFASRFNIWIKNIRADNGVYSAQLFRDACTKNQQNLTFCAVGAHWQNGIAERFIGTITQRARTILLHAMAKWPSVVLEDMWTFALWHAVNFHNCSIRKDATTPPYEAFTGQTPPWSLSDFRVFGSPVYVLHKELQDGTSLNKCKPRSWLGVYVGTSNCHASAVPLIYNPVSTHITPQYHLVYDEHFHTVNTRPGFDTDAYLKKLYESSAKWIYQDPYSNQPHLFEPFWDSSEPVMTSRKRKHPVITNQDLLGSLDPASIPVASSATPLLAQPAPIVPTLQEPLADPAQPT
jgi:hypothetical protein